MMPIIVSDLPHTHFMMLCYAFDHIQVRHYRPDSEIHFNVATLVGETLHWLVYSLYTFSEMFT